MSMKRKKNVIKEFIGLKNAKNFEKNVSVFTVLLSSSDRNNSRNNKTQVQIWL